MTRHGREISFAGVAARGRQVAKEESKATAQRPREVLCGFRIQNLGAAWLAWDMIPPSLWLNTVSSLSIENLALQLICLILFISNDQAHSRVFIPLTSFSLVRVMKRQKKKVH